MRLWRLLSSIKQLPASERALIRAKDQEIEELRARLTGLTNSRPSKMEPDTDQVTDVRRPFTMWPPFVYTSIVGRICGRHGGSKGKTDRSAG